MQRSCDETILQLTVQYSQLTVISAYLCCAIDKVIKNNDSLLSAQKRKKHYFWKVARWTWAKCMTLLTFNISHKLSDGWKKSCHFFFCQETEKHNERQTFSMSTVYPKLDVFLTLNKEIDKRKRHHQKYLTQLGILYYYKSKHHSCSWVTILWSSSGINLKTLIFLILCKWLTSSII